MIEAMSQTVADVIGRIGIISIWKTHPRWSPINEKSSILTTSENQALVYNEDVYIWEVNGVHPESLRDFLACVNEDN